MPRRSARILVNAVRVVSLVTLTFAALAGGIYFSSTSACKTPCRLDGSVSSRVAAIDGAPRRGKVESAPEQNGTSSAPQPPLPSLVAPPSSVKGKETPPPTPRRGDLDPSQPKPSVGMRTDLPRVEKPASTSRWTNAVFRNDASR
jgi:hypothetical protein